MAAPKPRGDDVQWVDPDEMLMGDLEGEWIRCAAYIQGHLLSRNGQDAVCGKPLTVSPEAWGELRQALLTLYGDEADVGEWWVAIDERSTQKCGPCKNGTDHFEMSEQAQSYEEAMKSEDDDRPDGFVVEVPHNNAAARLQWARFQSAASRVAQALDAEIIT